MKKRTILFVFSILFLSASFLHAETNHTKKQNKFQINNTIVVYNNLSMEIESWYDATLKNNKKEISQHKKLIFKIIGKNIKENHQYISYAKLNASYSNASGTTASKNQQALSKEESVFKSKKLLYESLNKTKSFAYSYRLLSDYLQILKNEIDDHKIEVADVSLEK